MNYTDFFDHVKTAGESTAIKTQQDPLDWFENSKHLIQPTIDAVTNLLKEIRECNDETTQNKLTEQLKLANKIRKITVAEAKSRYLAKLAEEIGGLS